MSRPISFISDFGLRDEFVGVVHGVLATVAPESRIIDLTHGIRPGAVRAAALSLMRSIQYLPQGVILAVVDPGVGTERRAIAAETAWGHFVGPDNGVLSPAVALMGGATKTVSIENPDVLLPSPGATFHGRDVFAPSAGVLASGEATIDDLGPTIPPDTLNPLLLPLPETENGTITGQAWWVDHFGNVQLNIGPDDLNEIGVQPGHEVTVRIGAMNHPIPWVTAYGDVPEGRPLIHVDSSGLMALAIRDGRATDMLAVSEGVPVVVTT